MSPKLRKLLTTPRAFARDMVRNQARRVRERLPRVRTVSSARRYSVVSAVYDVAPYLDDFFRSLTRQSLDFDRHIELILVDDGSRDASAEVIRRWQAKHPRAIRYLRKENGGQASARNLGLEHATGDWITFVDPDDFVDERYFERVDALLSRPDASDVVLVGCKIVMRRGGRDRDTHALRGQFVADSVVPVGPASSPIQLSAASAFFRGDRLRAQARRFDESLRPAFEDALFVGRYLIDNPGALGLCGSAVYHYRKREDASSTLDGSWSHPGRYGTVLERGYLELLRASAAASPDGRPARWAQRTVLYELVWYLRVLVDHDEVVAFLDDASKERFAALVRECVSYIDLDTILDFDLADCSHQDKTALLGLYKDAAPPTRRVTVDAYDPVKRELRLRWPHRAPGSRAEITLDGVPVVPEVEKDVRHELLGATFVHQRIAWLRAEDPSARLRVRIDGIDATLGVTRLGDADAPTVGAIAGALGARPRMWNAAWYHRAERRVATSRAFRRLYRDALVFMDRDSQADDNAEHLYRYVRRARPDLNAFFVLRRGSHDWDRLEREGFRLIPFGSPQHRLALANARHLISSHADHYVLGYPTVRHRRELQASRFTFLQHGVIKDDLSRWLNGKAIDCFVTASPAEHASIVESGPYRFTTREVVLTGLPRHDALLVRASVPPERVLLVMPTWRQWLAGPPVGKTAVRAASPEFYESEFATRWRSLLGSPALRALADRLGYRVVVFPHANLAPYLDVFAAPGIEVVSHRTGSFQDVLQSAALMLTDYTSAAFDMAYLRRPVVYYQFDRERTLGGGHTTRAGYYDYDRDGFGPVARDEAALLAALEQTLEHAPEPEPIYLERMERALPLRDGRCCERTLDAILAMDRA